MSTTSAAAALPDRALLERARGGDEDAYRRLVEPHRRELHAHSYRMLGSVHDAEDALQDAMLRAWRGLARFDGRSSLRTWLYRIATNTCLDALSARSRRGLPVDLSPAGDPSQGWGEPLSEVTWLEPYPDHAVGLEDGRDSPDARYERRESVELAFVAALQHLPPNQRAVLILREVLGFSAQETADALETTVASVNSALQRARRTVDERLPERSQQETLRMLGDEKLRELVERYADAMNRADVDAVVAMLAEDAAWSMPPLPQWFEGLDALRGFLVRGPLSGQWRWRRVPAHANGQLAVAAYTWVEATQDHRPFALDVLTLRGDRIAAVTSFIVTATENADRDYYDQWPDQSRDDRKVASVFGRFGLPERVE
jgi:RNA polymerase sigma-70 factor (ECF subfamily)